MLAKDLISDEIPAVRISDTGSKVISLMDENKVSHLPIVNNNTYLGLICDTDILDMVNSEDELKKHKLSLMRPFVKERQHVYDVIKIFSELNLTVLPVVDDKENFVGLISMVSLLRVFSSISSTNEPGGIIVLELQNYDYSLTQISQIIESNDGKILSCYVNSIADTSKIEVTLKINKQDLSGILQTFSRYDYKVKFSFHQSEFTDDLKKRFDSFMNFINI